MPCHEISPLQHDYDALSHLVGRAWTREHASHIDYSPQYLEFLLEDPQVIPDLKLGVYENGRLVSFLLSKEKTVRYEGHSFRTLFNTLAATDPDQTTRFPYLRLKQNCIDWALQRGFQISAGYVANGVSNNDIETVIAERNGFHCAVVSSFESLMKDLRTSTAGAANGITEDLLVRNFSADDLDKCLGIIADAGLHCDLYEIADRDALLHRLIPGRFVRSKLVNSGDDTGLVTYQIVDMQTAAGKSPMAIIGGIFLNAFSATTQSSVISHICGELQDDGVRGVIVPQSGYFDSAWARELGFRASPFRKSRTNLYLTAFDQALDFGDRNHTFSMEIV